MDVAIRELKARLSEYLDKVADGETIVVTNRGRPVARIIPPPRSGAVEQGLAGGWVSRRRSAPPVAFAAESPDPTGPGMTSTEVLRADRDS